MSSWPHDPAAPLTRRLLLIDLDWQDADQLPSILGQPGVSVRLVAGQGPHDPGVRMAELCDLPRTLDLADLTREIFDLAIVGERSARRAQLESLLQALGTPCVTPEDFLAGHDESPAPTVATPVPLPPSGNASLDAGVEDLINEALPTLTEPAPTPEPSRLVTPPPAPRIKLATLADFPSPEVRAGFEEALRELVASTGAGSAELHAGDLGEIHLIAQVGPEDRLLRGLIELANETGTPQVVTRQSDPGRGLTWAAWPFRTMQRRGVLAGAAIDPHQGMDSWKAMIEDLRDTWDREDRQRSAVAYPLTPVRATGWLDTQAFRLRIDLAVDRMASDGLRFELHRLEFPEAPVALEAFCATLPARLRDTDALCRPFPQVICLLLAGDERSFAALQARALQAWEQAWAQSGLRPPAMPFVDRHVALLEPGDREAFRTAADVWLAER